MTLLLWALARAQQTAGAWRLGACGALLGLLMLTREETLLLAPVLALWTLVGLARGSARAARARARGLPARPRAGAGAGGLAQRASSAASSC